MLQRAVAMLLGAVYEQDFRSCSYGFRPRRSAHQALQVLWEAVMRKQGGWVLELDIEDFFGSLDHQRLRGILRRRVRDGVVLRLIGKWLRAGVLEAGTLTYPEAGTPQGGVISPLLANVYLHEVLDEWFEDVVRPRLRGAATLVRFADDAVLVFAREEDARRVAAVLPKRLAKYGLTLHPEKTRLVSFQQPRSFRRCMGARGLPPVRWTVKDLGDGVRSCPDLLFDDDPVGGVGEVGDPAAPRSWYKHVHEVMSSEVVDDEGQPDGPREQSASVSSPGRRQGHAVARRA